MAVMIQTSDMLFGSEFYANKAFDFKVDYKTNTLYIINGTERLVIGENRSNYNNPHITNKCIDRLKNKLATRQQVK
jgi:hypothetical protein